MVKPILLSLLVLPLLAACDKKESAPPPETSSPTAPQAAAPSTPAISPPTESAPPPAPGDTTSAATSSTSASGGGDLAQGENVYKKTCTACHATGVTGAPKLGDKTDWQARIGQGKATLYNHAIKGYTGSKGMMPPKGGNTSLSDEEVKAAVDYMVSKSK